MRSAAICVALGCAALASAQTSAYLRDRDPGFWVTSATNTTPIQIQTGLDHHLAAGNTITLWNIPFDNGGGCGSGGMLEGRFQVKAAVDATHFTIADLAGVDVPARGVWCNGSFAGYAGGEQWGGKATPYTLAAGPKSWLDGDNGAFTRAVALGTYNGLVSLTVEGSTATAVTSFPNYVVDGQPIAVWNSGSAALDAAHSPYTVAVDSPTQFHFTVTGVAAGVYSGANNQCGPSGADDCLRLSTRAYTGNLWWDRVANQAPVYAPLRHFYDGGTVKSHAEPNWGYDIPGYFHMVAWKFLVDQKDAVARDCLIYWVTHIERSNGVGFSSLETRTDAGTGNNLDFGGFFLRDAALLYAAARSYLAPDQIATFRGKMLSDITDPASCVKNAPVQPGTAVTYVGGVLIGVGTRWLTDPDPKNRLNPGDAVYQAWPGTEYYIVSVESDTAAVVLTPDTTNLVLPFQYFISHKWQPGDCGAMWWYGHWQGAANHPALYPLGGGVFSNSPYVDGALHRPVRGGNNGYTNMAGYIAMALALADDDPRAVTKLERYESLWFDYFLPVSLGYTTGFMNTGAFYSFGRPMSQGPETASFLAGAVPSFPDLDLGGNWIRRPIMMKIYGVLPDNLGGSDMFWPVRWGTETGSNYLSLGNNAGPTSTYMEDWTFRWNPTSPEARYYRNWLTSKLRVTANTINPAVAGRLFASNSDQTGGSLDYTTLPTQYLFQATSQAVNVALGNGYAAADRGDGFISRTGWTNPADTHILFQARTYAGEHDAPQGGTLKIYKTGSLIGDGNLPPGGAVGGYDPTKLDGVLEFEGRNTLHDGWLNGDGASSLARIDAWAGAAPYGAASSSYVYARADIAGMYKTTIDRAKVHVAHFKKPGTEEIVLQYVDVDLSTRPAQLRGQIHYPQNGEAGALTLWPEGSTACPGSGGCSNLNATRWIHTQEDGLAGRVHSVTTKILSPSDVTVRWDGTGYTGSLGHSNRVSICGGASCGAAVSGADWLIVHKVNSTLAGDGLEATALNPDANWTGVQTADKVALFSRAGRLQLSAQFQTTHTGSAQYLIVGLEPGHTYRAYRRDDGSDVAVQDVLDGDNTFYFEGPAGNYAIFPTGLGGLFVGGRSPIEKRKPMLYDFKAAGDTGYVWSVIGGALPPGLQLSSDGVLSGTASETGSYGVTIRAAEAGSPAVRAEAAITLTVIEPPVSTILTAVSTRRGLLRYGLAGLDAATRCSITLSTRADFATVAEQFQDAGGAAIRQAVLGESTTLAAGSTYYVRADCGTQTGSTRFTTPAASASVAVSIPMSVSPPAAARAASVQVQYGPTRQLGSAVTASCGASCTVSIPALSGDVVYVRRVFLDGGSHVVAQSSVVPMMAPAR